MWAVSSVRLRATAALSVASAASVVAAAEAAAAAGMVAAARAGRPARAVLRARLPAARKLAQANSRGAHPPTVYTSRSASRRRRGSHLLRPSQEESQESHGNRGSQGRHASHESRASRGRQESHGSQGSRGSQESRARQPLATRSPLRLWRISSLHRRRKATRRGNRSRTWCGRRPHPSTWRRAAAAENQRSKPSVTRRLSTPARSARR